MDTERLTEEMARALWAAYAHDVLWDDTSLISQEEMRRMARQALARLDQLGLQIVPREPTEEMTEGGRQHHWGHQTATDGEERQNVAQIYRAMIESVRQG